MYICGRGKIGYLTGDMKEPVANDANYPTWDAENLMVMTWWELMCYDTTNELWDNVNKMYSNLGNQSQVYELILKLEEISQGEDTVTKYFNSLKRLWQDIDLYNDCGHYKKTVEDNRIFKFLIGLNVEFDEVRGRIIGRQPLPSIGEVFLEVRREKSHRLVMLGKRNLNNTVENSALAAGINASRNTTKKPDEKSRIWCDHCNRPWHTRETCWKIHGKLANWKGSHEGRFSRTRAAHEVESVPFNKGQMDQLLKLLNLIPDC